ncbi:MAG: endonuclease/exonuclease/phosphatase family protein [Zoogloeaceae bacterium]|jgi:endonuclease/exonuclease/phosphatase family metal-dependent hydrolase|nr:endonuclease/exonuclease/phosphatase family protein [Zoogloeaceae bacterium]
MRFSVTTCNIHKGFSPLNRKVTIHELKAALQRLDSDIVFLQEVSGANVKNARRLAEWPTVPQYDFLAEGQWQAAYGRNMVYAHGHHGNAILSRFPILSSRNQDVTRLTFERRGFLHCRIALPDGQTLHCVCAHLSLFGRSRRYQIRNLCAFIAQTTPDGPLIIAGDFNDWGNRLSRKLAQRLGVKEVFGQRPVRSFPAILPLLRLDRIYVRGLKIEKAERHAEAPWAHLSDHAALSATLADA